MCSFGQCPNQGGGEAPARFFWPFFHQVIVPKISQFILKSHIFVIIIVLTTIVIIGTLFCHRAKENQFILMGGGGKFGR